MTRRDLAAADEDTVCVWVWQIKGSTGELGARADRDIAMACVERRIDADGSWHGGRGKYVYKSESLDSGSVELVALHDVVALFVEDP